MTFIHAIRVAGSRMLQLVSSDSAHKDAELMRRVERAAAAGRTITKYIRSQGVDADDLDVKYRPLNGALFVYGTVKDTRTRDLILGYCHDVARITRVVDRMQVRAASVDPQAPTLARH